MMNRFVCALLFVVLTALAPCAKAAIPPEATGYWRTNEAIGFELVLVVGNYQAFGAGGPTTCGSMIRVDAAVPVPGNSLFGRGTYFDPSAGPIQDYVSMFLFKPFRPGVVGRLRVNAYDPVAGTLSVTLVAPNGPNGTFTMYRELLTPVVVSSSPC